MSEFDIPLGVEKSEISSFFNAFILQVFLMGMYIIIYIGAMYIYVKTDSSKHHVVPATITIQFLSSIIYTGLQWHSTKTDFIDNGGTRDSVFLSIYTSPQWLYIAIDVATYIVLVLADGLLIWRCFFVWGHSFRVILLPLLLLVIEIGLFVAQPVLHSIHSNSSTSPALLAMFNDLVSAAFFMTFATSLITTSLIAYKIYTFSKQTLYSTRRLKHILDIIVQSGAMYSLTVLLTALSGVLPGGSNVTISTQVINFQNYIEDLGVYVAGMSATIMVARVGLLPADTISPSPPNFSGLQFHAPTIYQTDIEEGTDNNIGVIDVDKMTPTEEEKVGDEFK